jgi:hypothetical protein
MRGTEQSQDLKTGVCCCSLKTLARLNVHDVAVPQIWSGRRMMTQCSSMMHSINTKFVINTFGEQPNQHQIMSYQAITGLRRPLLSFHSELRARIRTVILKFVAMQEEWIWVNN